MSERKHVYRCERCPFRLVLDRNWSTDSYSCPACGMNYSGHYLYETQPPPPRLYDVVAALAEGLSEALSNARKEAK